ncbi:hypothetical protein [Neobacillus sp. D3-1R]|uniref:hypothetical protein n=1 Tax=Neobacillus sp. D3-1R TaxID=3445778 RepID=UPI003FA16682
MRLLFLEGLPGTGKSTNSRMIMSQLEAMGRRVRWIHEVARPHPTLFFEEACLRIEEYHRFLLKYPDAEKILDKVKIKRGNTVSIDLLELKWKFMDGLDSTIFEELETFNVWNFPLEKYMEVALEKWEFFINYVKQEPGVTFILDSSIFQFQIYTFLEKNTPIDKLKEFINKLVSIVTDLDPSFIYLTRENVENSIAFLENRRGIQFLEGIWARDCQQPYYQDKPKGAEGYREFLRDYHHTANQLFNMVPFNKIAIDITNEDWIMYNTRIREFLCMKEHKVPKPLRNFNGIYVNKELGLHMEVRGDFMIDPDGSSKKIYSRSGNEYYVEDLPVILHFGDEGKLTILGEQLIARWTTYGTEYRKIR